ncbi:MAG: hypothetical protein ACR2QB_03720 [Gammaproteobacteria bacterium]
MIGSLARSFSRSGRAAPEPFNAPLFRSLIERIPEDERWVVLDLGAVCPAVISLFGGRRCRLDIADVAQGLAGLQEPMEPRDLRIATEALLPELHAEAADLVLCWDTVNYLNRDALTALMARIRDRCRAGTLVHALNCYSHAQMPIEPGHYVPQDDGSLINATICDEQRDAPRYSPEDLGLCMQGYTIDRAMLLSNGMQEFLFRL